MRDSQPDEKNKSTSQDIRGSWKRGWKIDGRKNNNPMDKNESNMPKLNVIVPLEKN